MSTLTGSNDTDEYLLNFITLKTAKYLFQTRKNTNNIIKNTKLYEQLCDYSGGTSVYTLLYLLKLLFNDVHFEQNPFALSIASQSGNLDVVKLLITNGSDIHYENEYALRLALNSNNLDIAKYLIKNGADVNSQIDDYLLYACVRQNLSTVEYLLEIHLSLYDNLCMVKYVSSKGILENYDILDWVSKNGYMHILKNLIKNGADIRSRGNLLINASKNGDLDMVKYLVKNGSDLNTVSDRKNVLTHAVFKGHLPIVKFLIKNGAKIQEGSEGTLDSACGDLSILEYLLDNAEFTHDDYNCALLTACEMMSNSTIDYLINKGAEINMDNGYLLKYAIDYKDLKFVKYLVNNGVDINANNNRALRLASKDGNIEIVKYLVKKGATLNNYLVSKGATVGNYLIKKALLNEHYKIVSFLTKVSDKY